MKLYQLSASPNSRRVRIFLEEKGNEVPVVPINLSAKKQSSEVHDAVSTLTLDDGAAIGEVLAIWPYLEKAFPERSLLGLAQKEEALVMMGERRAELKGFAADLDAVRNSVSGIMGHTPAGPHNYEQIPEFAERNKLLTENFYADLDTRLVVVPFLAGEQFSADEITAIVTSGIRLEELVSLKRRNDTVSAQPGRQPQLEPNRPAQSAKHSLRTSARSSAAFWRPDHAREPGEKYERNERIENKLLVLEAFSTLFNKRDYAARERYWSPNFIQHSAHIEPGREGLFSLIKSGPPALKYKPGMIVVDGDFVIVHGRFSVNGRPRTGSRQTSYVSAVAFCSSTGMCFRTRLREQSQRAVCLCSATTSRN